MIKIVKIEFLENNKILCLFDNKELRLLNLSEHLNDKYAIKILSNERIFRAAKVGGFGEIFWSDIGEIVELNGAVNVCDYDISPEFAYFNSKPVN